MAGLDIRIDGIKEFQQVLSQLGPHIAKNVINTALKKAADPLLKQERANASHISQTIAKSIKSVPFKGKWATPGIKVGPTRRKGVDPWFAHFVEFGVSGIGRFTGKGESKFRGKTGKLRYRSDQPARPFARPAIEQTQNQVKSNLVSCLAESLDNYCKKYRRNTAKLG